MDISARSYLNAGVSLTMASVIALSPFAVAVAAHPTAPPRVNSSDIRLAVSPADIGTFVDNLQTVLLDGTDQLAAAAGVPGQGLIGVVDNIVTMWDVLFTGLTNGTTNPTLLGSLAILKSFCVDAFEMLAHNLGRINAVITGTTAQVGELLTTALTGSLRNILVAAVNAGTAPLAPASYAGLLAAGVETGQLLVGNGLGVVQAVGDAGFDIVDIATDELTFQFDNAVGSLGKLLTQLGDASGSSLAKVVVSAVRGLAFTPALAVFNFGSQAIKAAIAAMKGGFDAVVGIGSSPAGSTGTATASAVAKDSMRQVTRQSPVPAHAAVRPTEKASAKAKPAAKVATRHKAAARHKTSTSAAASRTSATGHARRSAH